MTIEIISKNDKQKEDEYQEAAKKRVVDLINESLAQRDGICLMVVKNNEVSIEIVGISPNDFIGLGPVFAEYYENVIRKILETRNAQ